MSFKNVSYISTVNNNDSNDNNNHNHMCVYLCVIENELFMCRKYNSFTKADNAYKNNYINKHYQEYRNFTGVSTMIPICRYIPTYFHRFVLHYKLSNLFIKVRIQ
jgi:hypothetical protein